MKKIALLIGLLPAFSALGMHEELLIKDGLLYKKLLELPGQDEYYAQGIQLLVAGNYPVAKMNLDLSVRHKQNVSAYLPLGITHICLEEWRAAEHCFNTTMELHKDADFKIEAQRMLAYVAAHKPGIAGKALRQGERAWHWTTGSVWWMYNGFKE